MKRTRLLVALTVPIPVLGAVAIAASCSGDPDAESLKPGSGVYYSDSGSKESAAGDAPEGLDAGAIGDAMFDFERIPEVTSAAQAVLVLQIAYDGEIAESRTAAGQTKSYDVKTFADAVVYETLAASRRLDELIDKKGITPAASSLSSRMRFESGSATSHLDNIFPQMYDRAFMSRSVDSHNRLLRLIDEELAPAVAEDKELAKELVTSRAETAKRLGRAEEVLSGLDSFGGLGAGGLPAGF